MRSALWKKDFKTPDPVKFSKIKYRLIFFAKPHVKVIVHMYTLFNNKREAKFSLHGRSNNKKCLKRVFSQTTNILKICKNRPTLMYTCISLIAFTAEGVQNTVESCCYYYYYYSYYTVHTHTLLAHAHPHPYRPQTTTVHWVQAGYCQKSEMIMMLNIPYE